MQIRHMTQRMGKILEKTESKTGDIGLKLAEAKSSTHEFHELLVHTMDKALHCEVIISTPTSLLDHMIREAEEAQKIFKLIETDATLNQRMQRYMKVIFG